MNAEKMTFQQLVDRITDLEQGIDVERLRRTDLAGLTEGAALILRLAPDGERWSAVAWPLSSKPRDTDVCATPREALALGLDALFAGHTGLRETDAEARAVLLPGTNPKLRSALVSIRDLAIEINRADLVFCVDRAIDAAAIPGVETCRSKMTEPIPF